MVVKIMPPFSFMDLSMFILCCMTKDIVEYERLVIPANFILMPET